jgi:hypothetical protein
MGTLIYGPAAKELAIDDRLLAHLQAVIIAKMRRGESFAFNWQKDVVDGSGHITIWIHPAIYIEFVFLGSRRVPLNREWMEALMATANSAQGLELMAEPPAEPATS